MDLPDSYAHDEIAGLLGSETDDPTLWYDLRRFEAAALPIIRTLWELEQTEQAHWRVLNPYNEASRALHQQRCTAAISQLSETLGNDTGRCAAAFFLHPQLWWAGYSQTIANNQLDRVYAGLMQQIAEKLLVQQPLADWVTRVCRRMLVLCSAANPGGGAEFSACVGYLLACEPHQSGTLLDELSAGEWQAAWQSIVALAEGLYLPELARLKAIYRMVAPEYSRPRLEPVERLQMLWQGNGALHTVALLQRLFTQGRLNQASFRRLLEVLPSSLNIIVATLQEWSSHNPNPDFYRELRRLSDGVLWELLADLRPETLPILARIRYLSGGHYLLRLAEEVERRGLTKLVTQHRTNDPVQILIHLLQIVQRRPEDDSATLILLLQRIAPAALIAILPYATAYVQEICLALGWHGSVELIGFLRRLEEQRPNRSSDPSVGVLRRQDVLVLTGRMAEDHLMLLLEAFSHHYPSAITLLQAVLGQNRRQIRRLLGRRNQLAARAVALLPLEKPDELLERYLLLTRYQREIGSSRAGRKAYEYAAAQAGLLSLALNSGYPDATRLEWAMEDQLGTQGVSLGRRWEIEGYTLTLSERKGSPALEVCKGTRILKRTPTLVTRDYAYREVRTTLEQAQDQERRYRRAFLNAMQHGQAFTAEEVALLVQNPLASGMLQRLIFQDSAGAVGLFCAQDHALEGTHGEWLRINGTITIAHPYTLAQARLLADWQTEIVRRQLVQPFRQIFRELYLITPAELEAGYASARLAGRQLKSRQALAVLANMGWLIDGYQSISRPFYDLGYSAHFEISTTGYYSEEEQRGITGSLSFWPLRYQAGYYADGEERRMQLAKVSPLILSEVLRDLDLVTVIAHQSDEGSTSHEVMRQRGDLVRALATALGLAQIQVEEPYVTIRGNLTSYRIHLATAAIYTETGQYLCIVPKANERKAIYLPFEDGGEPIGSEIISKVLLLANDTRINDQSILAQIVPLGHAA